MAFLAQRMLEVVEETKLVLSFFVEVLAVFCFLKSEVFCRRGLRYVSEAVGYRTVRKEVQVSTRTPPNRYKNTPGPDIDLQSPNFENS